MYLIKKKDNMTIIILTINLISLIMNKVRRAYIFRTGKCDGRQEILILF